MIYELITSKTFWLVFNALIFSLVGILQFVEEKLKRQSHKPMVNPVITKRIVNGRVQTFVRRRWMEVIELLFASEQHDHLGTG